jgi:hypothetical protein
MGPADLAISLNRQYTSEKLLVFISSGIVLRVLRSIFSSNIFYSRQIVLNLKEEQRTYQRVVPKVRKGSFLALAEKPD